MSATELLHRLWWGGAAAVDHGCYHPPELKRPLPAWSSLRQKRHLPRGGCFLQPTEGVALGSRGRGRHLRGPPQAGAVMLDGGGVANADAEARSQREGGVASGGEGGQPRWQRVLLKVSGEALAGNGQSNVDPQILAAIAREVAAINRMGIEVAIVVGGGNFFRGAQWAGASGLDRASADQIGMIATIMNAIFLQASLESIGVPTRVQTAFRLAEVAEPYIRRRAMRHLQKGRVVIFGAGTGNPFFTTDTAAALRAAEINAQVVLKATNVDGVYDCDPRDNKDARLHSHVSYSEVATRGLSVMDATAITLCQENNIPVVVFNLNVPGNITKALRGERIGTLIDDQPGVEYS